MPDLNVPEPPPQRNDGVPIWELVVKDMQARDYVGRARYGTPLQADNGRNPLVDAYQEALDLAVYLRQAIAELDALAECRRRCEGLAERVAAQSELLTRRALKQEGS